jgi:hypothetical protein
MEVQLKKWIKDLLDSMEPEFTILAFTILASMEYEEVFSFISGCDREFHGEDTVTNPLYSELIGWSIAASYGPEGLGPNMGFLTKPVSVSTIISPVIVKSKEGDFALILHLSRISYLVLKPAETHRI